MGKVRKLKVVLRTFDETPFVVLRTFVALRALEGLTHCGCLGALRKDIGSRLKIES